MARRSFLSARKWDLGLERNVLVLAFSVFGISLAEELWQAFLPKYLAALGAGGAAIGLFASTRDLLDGLYQFPGGWFTDRFGRKRTLMLFTATAMTGYATYALARSWGFVFAGLLLVMAWKAGAFPATFAVIGDSLPKGRRAVAFGVQSILVRVPRIIGAPLGGILLLAGGVAAGMRVALTVALLLAGTVLLVQQLEYREPQRSVQGHETVSFAGVWKRMPPGLRRLLVSDCLVRIGEGLAASFIVLYVTDRLGVSTARFGILYAIQQAVSVALYIPTGKLADAFGRRPLVALTFVFFAAFPLAVRLSDGFGMLVMAFVVGGLKEVGEPARKSLILDLAEPALRGRAVGVYYTIRNLVIVPAGLIGGLLWQRSAQLPLVTACVVGTAGVVFYLIVSAGSRDLESDLA